MKEKYHLLQATIVSILKENSVKEDIKKRAIEETISHLKPHEFLELIDTWVEKIEEKKEDK